MLLLLGGGFLFLYSGLSLGQCLLVSAEDRLVELRLGLLGAGKADILVFAVSGSRRAPAQLKIVWEEEEQRNE